MQMSSKKGFCSILFNEDTACSGAFGRDEAELRQWPEFARLLKAFKLHVSSHESSIPIPCCVRRLEKDLQIALYCIRPSTT